ncbi:MAG: glycosyltransferase [Candidatus Levybacteria bacterium]|nr:glycosyltransferase [Candidatus Levybacteria bacterium]
MNILIVSSYLPFPLFSGGNIRLYNIIKRLSKHHQVTLVAEMRKHQTEDDINEVKKICKSVYTVTRSSQWSLENIAKTGISSKPFLVVGHKSREMQEIISGLLEKEKFDLIHVETFYVAQNIPQTSVPIVLVEHNIEYLVYKRFADGASPVLRPFLYADVMKMKRYESMLWKTVDRLVAVSEVEKTAMKRADAVVVPNGVDTEKYKMNDLKSKTLEKEKKILFIGDFKWIQNRNAAAWIITEIWPLINSKFTNQLTDQDSKLALKLWIVGKHIPDSIKFLSNDPSIILDENAPKETEKIYSNAYMLLAPIRVGGGTSYKILEAMACGLPVVTTVLGVEGLGAKDGKEVLIGDDTNILSQNVIRLLKDPKIYRTIGENARKLIEKNFEWGKIVERLENVYKSLK